MIFYLLVKNITGTRTAVNKFIYLSVLRASRAQSVKFRAQSRQWFHWTVIPEQVEVIQLFARSEKRNRDNRDVTK